MLKIREKNERITNIENLKMSKIWMMKRKCETKKKYIYISKNPKIFKVEKIENLKNTENTENRQYKNIYKI